jgi:hypothetical protein
VRELEHSKKIPNTPLATGDPLIRMLRDVAGIDQVPYGMDFPYLRRDLAINSKQRILQSSELNDFGNAPTKRTR